MKIVGQAGVKDFQETGRSIGKKYLCTKLGEGAYADVYELHPKDLEEAKQLKEDGGLIIKVIQFRVTDPSEADVNEIADLDAISREIQLFQTFDALHGFVRCRGVHILSGDYPDVLSEAFSNFKKTHTKGSAQNLDPSKTAVSDSPLYAMLEMNHAGSAVTRLSQGRVVSAFQVFDVFWKTAVSLAHAEREVEFEHRDLHSGNVCWKSLHNNGQPDVSQDVIEYMEKKPEIILGLSNLEVTIIDYTLSRAVVGNRVIFDPMEYWDRDYEEGANENEGEKRQYKVYSVVRELAMGAEAEVMAQARQEGSEYKAINKYERFIPKSNVLWLRNLLVDLLSMRADGRGACVPGSSRAAKKLQMELWGVLEGVVAYLNGTAASALPAGADAFIGMAVEEEWLGEGDVAAYMAQIQE